MSNNYNNSTLPNNLPPLNLIINNNNNDTQQQQPPPSTTTTTTITSLPTPTINNNNNNNSDPSNTRLLHSAKLAESCGLHAEAFSLLASHLVNLAMNGMVSNVDQEIRTQLSLSLVNLTQPWRMFLNRVPEDTTTEDLEALRKTILERLINVKNTVTELSDHLVGNDVQPETAVWAFKIKGDLHRYVAEASGSVFEARVAEQAFADGLRRAQLHLPPTSPLRLGLALNYGSFCYDILRDADRARRIAQDALDESDAELHAFDVPQNLPDTNYVSQLVRKALTKWEEGGEGT
jgi:14-3-3 protein epsilon